MILREVVKKITDVLRGERGGSMVELSLIAPIMLLISGATIDIGRFLKYQQVTSTVSQELANHIYRKCSDMTAFIVPRAGTADIDTSVTQSRVQSCADAEKAKAERILARALPGSYVTAHVFRHNIDDFFTDAPNCSASLTHVVSAPTGASDDDEDPDHDDPSPVTRPVQGGRNSQGQLPPEAQSRIQISGNSLKNANNNKVLASGAQVCKRNRLVAVEVGYEFKPIISFLPRFLPGFAIDRDGTHRETTIL
jgi:Flp pilus assembly protein TadG